MPQTAQGVVYPDRDSAYPAIEWWEQLAQSVDGPLGQALGAKEYGTVDTTGPGQVINFEDIPQTHHHIAVVGQCRSDSSAVQFDTLRMTFGGLDNALYEAAQYRVNVAQIDGSALIPGSDSGLSSGPIATVNSSTLRGSLVAVIPNYSHSSAHRGAHSVWYANAGATAANTRVGVNGVTAMSFGAAVGRVRFHVLGGGLDAGSRLTMLLLGVR